MYYVLIDVRQLRNATAHNNYVINDMRPLNTKDTSYHEPRLCVKQAITKIKIISQSQRTRRMSNIRMYQIITLLYAHTRLVQSKRIKQQRSSELHEWLNTDLLQHEVLFKHNDLILSNNNFFKKIIDEWFPLMLE